MSEENVNIEEENISENLAEENASYFLYILPQGIMSSDAQLLSTDGTNYSNMIILDNQPEGTQIKIYVRNQYTASSGVTYYFWGWTDGYKGFDRTFTMTENIQKNINVQVKPIPVNKIVLGGSDQTEKQRVLLDLSSDTVDANHLAQNYSSHDKTGSIISGNLVNVVEQYGEIITLTDNQSELVMPGSSYIPADSTITLSTMSDNHISDNILHNVTLLGVTGSDTVYDVHDATLNNNNLLPYGIKAYGIEDSSYNTVKGKKYTGTATDITSTTSSSIRTVDQVVTIDGGSTGKYIRNSTDYPNAKYEVSIGASEQAKIISDNIKKGINILGVDGSSAVVDTSDATLDSNHLLPSGTTAYANGTKYTGDATILDGTTIQSFTDNQSYITLKYENGGYLSPSPEFLTINAQTDNLKSEYIKSGIKILGTTGTYSTSEEHPDDTAYGSASLVGWWSGHPIAMGYTINPNVTTIDNYAFYYKNALQSITNLEQITTLGSYAFFWCSSLTTLNLENLTTMYNNLNLRYAFYGCSGLTSLNFSKLVSSQSNSIFSNAFERLTAKCVMTTPNIYYVYVSSSLSTIGYGSLVWSDGTNYIIAAGSSSSDNVSIYATGSKVAELSSSLTTITVYNKTFTWVKSKVISISNASMDYNELVEDMEAKALEIYGAPTEDENISSEPDYSSMTQEELIEIINQQNQRIEELENIGTEEE